MFGMQDVAVLQAAVKTRSKVQVRNRIQKVFALKKFGCDLTVKQSI